LRQNFARILGHFKLHRFRSFALNDGHPITDSIANGEIDAERYEVQGKAAFEQIFLGQTVSDDVVATALTRLNSGADLETIGERTLLPTVVPLSPHTAINATFGRGFAGALVVLPTGQWAGPVQSGYGQHLVQVKEQSPARLPPLDDIRDQVEAGWREVRARDMSEAMFEELRARYEIDIEIPGT
jgi:PPIC-type PPIASE domain